MAGRNPISKKNLNPTAKINIATGMRGIGKTYQTHQEIKQYLQFKKLPVVAYDINADDYEGFKVVHPKYVKNITSPQKRRVIPYHAGGKPMGLEEQKETLYYLLTNFRNGMLVLDDIDKYATGMRGQKVVGAITTNRHRGVDLLITHQSVRKISPTEWENVNTLRMHHQVDDIDKIKERVPNFPLLKIAQYIVDDVYFAAMNMYDPKKSANQNKITFENFLKLRGYFVYVNMDEHKIYRASKKQFIKAVQKYLRTYPHEVRKIMKAGTDDGTKLDRNGAIAYLTKKYMQYYGGE